MRGGFRTRAGFAAAQAARTGTGRPAERRPTGGFGAAAPFLPVASRSGRGRCGLGCPGSCPVSGCGGRGPSGRRCLAPPPALPSRMATSTPRGVRSRPLAVSRGVGSAPTTARWQRQGIHGRRNGGPRGARFWGRGGVDRGGRACAPASVWQMIGAARRGRTVSAGQMPCTAGRGVGWRRLVVWSVKKQSSCAACCRTRARPGPTLGAATREAWRPPRGWWEAERGVSPSPAGSVRAGGENQQGHGSTRRGGRVGAGGRGGAGQRVGRRASRQ